jgi:NADP-dependent 3-hydroxy acid dehydrogenase YdfG
MTVFRGQLALVTGASSGIGKAIALSLAEHGATVCLVARRLKELETIAASSRAVPPELLPYQADIDNEKDLNELATRLRTDFGYIDILVHSAGVISLGPVAWASVTDFERQYRTNVLAPYALTQALLPMLRLRRGQIVFVNSTAGLVARESVSQYAATKHALKAIADSLREEVNQDGVRVLSIYLGRTATPMQATVHTVENKAYRPENLMQADDVATMVLSALSLPRTAEVTEIRIRPFKRPKVGEERKMG